MEKKRRKRLIAVVILLVLAVACAGGFYLVKSRSGQENGQFPGGGQMPGGMPGGQNTGITATGTTVIGMDVEEFEPDYIDTDLEIEEVYLESGDQVEAGTAILKVSQDSVEDAREELEETLTKASLAYRAGIISYKQSGITNAYDRDSAVLAGEQAQEVYEETVADLDAKLQDAQDAVTDTQEEIAEYEEILSTNRYYTDYRVQELQDTYQEDYDLFCKFLSTYGITSANVETGKFDEDQTQPPRDELQVYQSFWKTIKQEAEELTQAKENYQKVQDSANETLQELYIEIETLEAKLVEQQASYDTDLLEAQSTYETAMAKAQLAQTDYETAMKKAQETLDGLEDAETEAQENLNEFESLLGDGILRTTSSGDVIMVAYEAGDTLDGNSVVLAFSDTSTVQVSVSVSQDDVATLFVGQSATVTISDAGTFEGIVTEINPVSNSSGRSSVTYTVTVTLSGDVSELSANMTAQVSFLVGNAVTETNETQKNLTTETNENPGKPEETSNENQQNTVTETNETQQTGGMDDEKETETNR